jgi:ribokinase
MSELVNLGSFCIDYVYSVPSIVRVGETLLGTGPVRHAGGKGLNQSLAAARAGATVAHFGRVGLDGTWLTDMLAEAGVDVAGVHCCESHPTGHAMIQVGAHGENAIVIVAGANHHIQPDDVARAIARVGGDGWLLMQNEINDIDDVLAEARRAEIRVALNIAPSTGVKPAMESTRSNCCC